MNVSLAEAQITKGGVERVKETEEVKSDGCSSGTGEDKTM